MRKKNLLLLCCLLMFQLIAFADTPAPPTQLAPAGQQSISPTLAVPNSVTTTPAVAPSVTNVTSGVSNPVAQQVPVPNLPNSGVTGAINPQQPTASPIPAADPYSTEVKVSSYGDAERIASFGVALQQLLVATSGNANIVAIPQIKSQLKNAANFVQSFSYSNHPALNNQQNLFLKVQFNANSIEQLLQQATQSVWTAKRPMTLVWLTMVYSAQSKSMIDDSSNDIVVNVLHKDAQNFGMPIMFPTFDLQDSSTVKAEDICNQKVQAIQVGSMRYGVSSVLAGCVIKPVLGTNWISHWVFINKGKTTQWNTNGVSAEDVVTQAMLNASQSYGKKAPQVSDLATDVVVLRITNVKGLDQYTEVVKYLRTLSPVTQVDLLTLDPDEIQVNVNCIGGQQALITALNAQSRLVPNTAAAPPPGVNLDYRLADAPK